MGRIGTSGQDQPWPWPKTRDADREVERLQKFLRVIQEQLRTWATESRTGGWSTHQVEPMRKLADQIDDQL